jgi:tetratricopeptide (TPR) repeat protein
MTWFSIVLALLFFGGCAARQPIDVHVATVNEAHVLVRTGCYSCLRDALAMFENAAAARPSPDVARAALTTSILLVVRARELGLPEQEFVERARFWSGYVQPSAAQLSPAAYFDAIELVQGDTSGLVPRERERRANHRRSRWTQDGSVPPARATLSPYLTQDLAAEYLALTLDCEDAHARKTLDPDAVRARHPVPLIEFRLHMCTGDADGLRRLGETDARWRDTLFSRGRLAMIRAPSPRLIEAADLLTAAHQAFPESHAITLSLAALRNALADHAGALTLFDNVLEALPQHPDALLGRLVSQSYLNRYADAVVTATALIDLDTDHLAPAWYWRAWNRYHLHHLADAWRDVTRAMGLDANASSYALAGVIAYARQWPVTAIDRLRAAYALDSSHCDAVWTEASVHVDQEDWRTAADRFAIAVDCFGQTIEQGARDVRDAQEAIRHTSSGTRQLLIAEERLESAQRRRAQAAFNAANGYARAGDRDTALRFLGLAARHPLMAQKSAELERQILKN